MRQRTVAIVDYRELLPDRTADLALSQNEVVRSLRVLKCTRERMRGIECKALKKLRNPRRCHNLIGYIEGASEHPLIEGLDAEKTSKNA